MADTHTPSTTEPAAGLRLVPPPDPAERPAHEAAQRIRRTLRLAVSTEDDGPRRMVLVPAS